MSRPRPLNEVFTVAYRLYLYAYLIDYLAEWSDLDVKRIGGHMIYLCLSEFLGYWSVGEFAVDFYFYSSFVFS